MQATVATFDSDSHSGELLLDDGSRLPYGADAFALSGLRLLRLGQRVQVEQGPDGSVEKISIPTL